METGSRRLALSSSAIAREDASVSRQPRLPQRQTGPPSASSVWPISPAVPPTPCCSRPPEIEPGADAGGDLDVGDLGPTLRRAPNQFGERAEVGVVLDLDRKPEPARGLRRGVDPDPARQDRGGLHRPGSAIDRRRQAHPDADHPVPIDARLVEDPLDELGGRVEALIGGVVDVHLAPRLGEHRVREIGDGDPQMTMAEVEPDREARRAVERDHHRGRPAWDSPGADRHAHRRGRPRAGRRRSSRSSIARGPVIRASSARLATPRSRRASITRLRLPSRSDASEPLSSSRARIHFRSWLFVKA